MAITMQEDEVSSLITEEIDGIEDDSLQSFIEAIVQHERSHLDNKFAEFNDKYDELVKNHADNQSLDDFDS
ncbi:hypothetical protein EA462_00900 [Natrarchaeobius halalkaliphilus]|uniref:Uncharacterized protein n=2 Tax=Natrarchaeobius halalkaliphilus TaxID=1679091 RepID=A0A3N6LVN3_9EURY|nr:hypothetical protein EA462_00900 [Natrarchaeobius halalkaliphilus]